MLFETDSILPAAPIDADGRPFDTLHDREYRVRAFRLSDERLLLQGAVRDQKPPGLYFANDPEPLTIHHMQVELEVVFPSLEIDDVRVVFEAHPHTTCPTITEHYASLVGLSIARGFTHRVRELFGGPRGCTHTTALLQAMAPVAVQCLWSMRASMAQRAGTTIADLGALDPEHRRAMWASNLNSCHVWDEHGEHVAALEAGEAIEVPLFARRRLEALGVDPEVGWQRMRG
jgi:hypothetical protein